MSIFIAAQVIGVFGYLACIYGPYQDTKEKILRMDVIACSLLMIQWLLLGLPMLAMNNGFVLLSTLIALSKIDEAHKDKLIKLLIPLFFIGFLQLWSGHQLDVIALIAATCLISMRLTSTQIGLRSWGILGGITLIIAATMAQALPAIIFNTIFTFGHIQKLLSSVTAAKEPVTTIA